MDEIAIVKKQAQKAEWTEKIRKCSESGLTVSEWCRENGINLKTYYYHLRKLRKEICEQIPVPVMTFPEECHSVKFGSDEHTINNVGAVLLSSDHRPKHSLPR